MDRQSAVLDASFWINAERAGLTPFLRQFFHLYAPPRVAAEILAPLYQGVSGTGPRGTQLFAEWREQGDVRVESPIGSYGRFDAGENEAIALARERDWLLLIDDEAPRHYSRGPLALRVVDSPALTVFLYDRGELTYGESVAALSRNLAARRLVREALVDLRELAHAKGDAP